MINYVIFDNTTSYYNIVFNNTISNIPELLLDNIHYDFNIKELYTITNIVSYYIINNMISKEVVTTYLLNIYMNGWNNNSSDNNFNYSNIFKNKYKNARTKLCLKLFEPIFDYEWEYFNINLHDLFNIICCVVYKKYNKLYEILYNIKIHKSLMILKTMHILINYKNDIDNLILVISKENDDICLLKCVVLFILYNYIENIHHYIIQTEFKKLIPIIIQKSLEIKSLICDNKRMPNNLKLMFLKKISNVYNIFTDNNKLNILN